MGLVIEIWLLVIVWLLFLVSWLFRTISKIPYCPLQQLIYPDFGGEPYELLYLQYVRPPVAHVLKSHLVRFLIRNKFNSGL